MKFNTVLKGALFIFERGIFNIFIKEGGGGGGEAHVPSSLSVPKPMYKLLTLILISDIYIALIYFLSCVKDAVNQTG